MRVPNKSKQRLARQRAGVMDEEQRYKPARLARKLGGGGANRHRQLTQQRRELAISRFTDANDKKLQRMGVVEQRRSIQAGALRPNRALAPDC